MKHYCTIILLVIMASAKAQTTEDDFLAGNLENPEDVTMLFLENRNLTELPDTFEKLVNLESLYLSENKLTNLPKSFATLKNLKTLDLSNNELKELPENFRDLKNLEMLVLSNNQLTSFDESICSLSNLDFLHISNNLIKTIPDCIAKLQKVTSLGISGDSFTKFPTSVLKMSKLEILLYENAKTDLPNLKSFKKLKRVFINQNFYAKNKSKIKKLLPSGCKVNPDPELLPPLKEPTITEEDEKNCFLNVLKTETKNKIATIESLFEFGYSNESARIIVTKTVHTGENIKQRLDDAKKEGMQIVPEMTVELLDGTFLIENKLLTFKENDSKKVRTFKISYKQNTKIIDKLIEVETSQVYKTGPCFAPMPSMGN